MGPVSLDTCYQVPDKISEHQSSLLFASYADVLYSSIIYKCIGLI